MKPLLLSLLLSSTILLPEIAIAQPNFVTAKQVNGTWKSQLGTFKIWALGQQRLQVEFSGTYVYKMPNGQPMANMGAGSGIATIERRTARFKPAGAEDNCSITMNFVGSQLQVSQTSNCGFGMNVTAAGNYRKVSGTKPQFGND
jgi:hypothetical protein